MVAAFLSKLVEVFQELMEVDLKQRSNTKLNYKILQNLGYFNTANAVYKLRISARPLGLTLA